MSCVIVPAAVVSATVAVDVKAPWSLYPLTRTGAFWVAYAESIGQVIEWQD